MFIVVKAPGYSHFKLARPELYVDRSQADKMRDALQLLNEEPGMNFRVAEVRVIGI